MRGVHQFMLASGFLFATCGLGVALYLPILQEPVRLGEPKVDVSVEGGQTIVLAEVTIVPRVRARVRTVGGRMRVGQETLSARVSLDPPDGELRAERPETATLRVEIPAATMVRIGSGSILRGGRIALAFEGTARVEVLGLPYEVPLHVEHEIDATRIVVDELQKVLPRIGRGR